VKERKKRLCERKIEGERRERKTEKQRESESEREIHK
jgi:hypothetical protein